MKLAEALIERAELQKKNAQLYQRIERNALVQEGDAPAEEPAELMAEYEGNMERLLLLIRRINATNSVAPYRGIYEAAAIRQDRYSQKEVKFVRCVDVKAVQDTINRLSKEYRETDTKLQAINWTTDLVD